MSNPRYLMILYPHLFRQHYAKVKHESSKQSTMNWDESEHPRDHGKFASKGSGESVSDTEPGKKPEKKTEAPPKLKQPVKSGQEVKIKKEWQDAGDDKVKWIAVSDEDNGMVMIQPQVDMPFKPTQRVKVEWLE